MPVTFRKAAASDIDAVTAIYDAIHTEEEAGRTTTGWKRGIYPVRATAEAALTRGDLFVAERRVELLQIAADVAEQARFGVAQHGGHCRVARRFGGHFQHQQVIVLALPR